MIILNAKYLHAVKEKSIGLIGKKRIEPVFFSTRWGLHTFGVLSPIDVLVLDKKYRVVKLIENLPPNRIFFWNPKYKNIVELPPGTIAKKEITPGTIIKIPACR